MEYEDLDYFGDEYQDFDDEDFFELRTKYPDDDYPDDDYQDFSHEYFYEREFEMSEGD